MTPEVPVDLSIETWNDVLALDHDIDEYYDHSVS